MHVVGFFGLELLHEKVGGIGIGEPDADPRIALVIAEQQLRCLDRDEG
jgi:hypothetical protein